MHSSCQKLEVEGGMGRQLAMPFVIICMQAAQWSWECRTILLASPALGQDVVSEQLLHQLL